MEDVTDHIEEKCTRFNEMVVGILVLGAIVMAGGLALVFLLLLK